jgi:hypothetical protein
VQVLLIGRSVQLQVDLVKACGVSSFCETLFLRKADPVRDDADAFEANAPRATDGVDEMAGDRRFAAGEQKVDIPLRLD